MRNGEYLYIGSSINVLSRLANHHTINKVTPVLENDKINVIFCDSVDDMQWLEIKLIRKYKPKYNKRIL